MDVDIITHHLSKLHLYKINKRVGIEVLKNQYLLIRCICL